MSHAPRQVLAIAAAALMLAGCASSPTLPEESNAEVDSLQLRLNFPYFAADHAWFIAGIESGIYEDAGINLTLNEGTGGATTLKLVAEGSEPLGLVDAGTMMSGVGQGMPVRSVGVLIQANPMAIIFKEDSSIKDVSDLKGKTIADVTGGAPSQIFPAVLEANGISPSEVNMVYTADGAGKQTAMLQDQADAFLGYWSQQPVLIENTLDQKVRYLKYSDLGVDSLSSALIVNTEWEKQNADALGRFLRATQDAIELVADDPEWAAQAYVDNVEGGVYEVALGQIEAALQLLHTDATKSERPLITAESDWVQSEKVLSKYASLKVAEGGVESYYTNEYLK